MKGGEGRQVSALQTTPWQSQINTSRASRPLVRWPLRRKLNDSYTNYNIIPHAVLKTALPGDCTLLYPSPLNNSGSSREEGKRGLTNQPEIKGIVHFVGGAFAGAAPVSLYSEFLEYIVEDGFSVIVTPYQVTFRHDSCARNLDSLFSDALDILQTESSSFDTAMMVPTNVPVFGIGHSNGALMHALIGSDFAGCSRKPAANILISFNNRQVAEAVPVPLTPLRDAVNSVRKGDETLEEQTRMATRDAINALSWLPSGGKDAEMANNAQRGVLDSMYEILPATAQIGSVLDEVGDGLMDFVPSPEENRRLIASNYSVKKTLILQFRDDSIDESSVLFRTLKRNPRRAVTYTTLDYGSHTTPLNIAAPAEIKKLASTVVAFLNKCSTVA